MRNAIALALRKFAGKSNREISAQIGCSDHTVEAERKEQVAGAQVAHLPKRTGADGKTYPAKREAAAPLEKNQNTDTQQMEGSRPNAGAQEARKNSTAMQHVSDAIAALRKIKKNDPARADAFAHIRKWITENE